jgi:hypothetical protein
MDMWLEIERRRLSLAGCRINSGGSPLNESGECWSKAYGKIMELNRRD